MTHYTHPKTDWNKDYKPTNEICQGKEGSAWEAKSSQVHLIGNPDTILKSDAPTLICTPDERTNKMSVPPRSLVRATITGQRGAEVELLTAHLAGGRFDDQLFSMEDMLMFQEREAQSLA